MKHRLLVVVLIMAVATVFTVLSVHAFVQGKMAGTRDAAVQLVNTESVSEVAGAGYQVAWQSSLRKARFRRV